MGNQMFQVAALLGYAERHGHSPVFLEEPGSSREHPETAFRAHKWANIPVRPELQKISWIPLKLGTFVYESPPYIADNVLLDGYAQCEAYGPSKLPTFSPRLSTAMIGMPWHTLFFLHVRRGDYLHPANAHHAVDLRDYYRQSLAYFPKEMGCFVVSDDMEWCKANVPNLDPGRQWIWCPSLPDTEVLFWMSACEGGICANSTFSWWGAKLGHDARKKGRYIMPATWGHGPAFANTRDLYPSWANVSRV